MYAPKVKHRISVPNSGGLGGRQLLETEMLQVEKTAVQILHNMDTQI